MPVTCTNYKLKCGGCPLLNQPYPDQLKHKQQLEQHLLGGSPRYPPCWGRQNLGITVTRPSPPLPPGRVDD